MASASVAAGGGAALPPELDTTSLKNTLYDLCAEEAMDNPRAVFHQNSILEFNIIPNRDLNTLLLVTQKLVDEKLFKAVNDGAGLGWMLRTMDEARKYRSLTTEQEIVYAIIDEAGEEGVWTKTIKLRSNLHEAVYKAALKHLEGKHMIADMKSVEHPARKMYIKASIRPSDRATGGAWFTDGELDEEFIEMIMMVLYERIKKKSFYYGSAAHSPRTAKKSVRKMSPEDTRTARGKGGAAAAASAGTSGRIKTEHPDPSALAAANDRPVKKRAFDRYLPMPAGYRDYPTLNELTAYVESSPFTTQVLTAVEIQHLLDILIYDDKIEKIVSGAEGFVYRALRKGLADEEDISSLLTEAPCGRCPVFDLCEEGGPVGPSNCEYFNDWLNL